MGLFKKRSQKISDNTLSSHIANYVNSRQRKLADYLNIRTRNVSGTALLFGLIVFCAAFGSYLIYLLVNAFGAFN